MEKVRLGVIGAGSWTIASHLPNLARHRESIEFVAVCRQGTEALERIRAQFGFEYATEDYSDLLSCDLDIVVVASPTALHHEHAKAALESGAHVLCEKPFTLTSDEAWDLVETSERMGKQLVVSFGWNYRPMLQQAKKLLSEFGLGTVEQLSISMSSSTRELLSGGTYPQADPDTVPDVSTWNDPQVSGGGYAQGQLSHALGMAFWLLELRAVGAFALMTSPLGGSVEQHDAIVLEFDNGAIGTVAGGSAHLGAMGDKHAVSIRAIGSEGQMHVDVERERVWLYRPDGVNQELIVASDAGWYDCVGPVETLIQLGLGGSPANASDARLGARTVEALELAYNSARSGRLERR